jgi:biotin carboxyl carrier protein
MTRFEAEIDGQTHQVVFEPAGERLRVLVDGRERLVDARAFDGFFYSLLIGQHSYEVTVEENEEGFRVQVGTEALQVRRLDPLRSSRPGGARGRSGPTRVRSLMPGKVVRILVEAGQQVAEGQPLVVVEAMKMENEVRSPGPGKVTRVCVTPGATVEGGADLVTLE